MAAGMRNPSSLPGTHRNRVFLGGSYAAGNRSLLTLLEATVRQARFEPVIADQYSLLRPERDIHDVTLFLLHACRLAIFEVSTLSGALMEIERLADYGLQRALLLYQHPGGQAWPRYPSSWRSSQMLRSLALEQQGKIVVRVYTRPRDAVREGIAFLRAIRRSVYGRLHGL